MQPIEVVLADLSPVVVSGFRNILEKHPVIRVVREVTTLSDLEEAFALHEGRLVFPPVKLAQSKIAVH
jgi:hypothetical protein